MGVSVRIFVVNDDDSIQRLSNARFERCFDDETERLHEYAGRRLRYAYVIVRVEGREVLDILNTHYSILPLNDDGSVDQDKWFQHQQHATDQLDMILRPPERTNTNVINAKQIFALKTYKDAWQWTPSSKLKQKIVDAIFFVKPTTNRPRNRGLKLVR